MLIPHHLFITFTESKKTVIIKKKLSYVSNIMYSE
jgi:hypothetical protein